MKTFSLLLLLLPLALPGQNTDSTAIRQVDSLIQESITFGADNDFDKGLEVIAAAEKIALHAFGRESEAYGSCCHNHGNLLSGKGDYPESEKWFLEAITIREKVLGKGHPDYAISLISLADLYTDLSQNEKAEQLYLEAIAIQEKTLGREDPDYASSLNNLAILYKNQGLYDQAEKYYLQSRDIREKVFGKQNPEYASSLSNLATLYLEMGQYEKAEGLYLEAKAIREKVLGRENPYYARNLDNLANLYTDMGQYEKAEQLHLEALDIREKVLGKEHPDYAMSLGNLADLYSYMGQYELAERLYLEAKDIWEKTLGKDHPVYATILGNLVILYHDTGQFKKSETFYLETLDILEKEFGKENPNYARTLGNLATIYIDLGQYEKAVQLHLQSMAIQEKVLDKEHPDYAANQHNLAVLYRLMGQSEKAVPLILELSVVNRHMLEKAIHHLSESELNNYLNRFSERQNEILSFAQTDGSKKTIPVCFDNSLFYKGFLLHAITQVKRLANSNPAASDKFNLLKSYGNQLASEYSLSPDERDSAKVADLEEKANALEKDLARTVAGYGEAMRQVNWQDVKSSLRPGEAALELVHYHFYYNFKETDSIMYVALLLRPDLDQPQFIPLFEEKQLDSLLKTGGERRSDYVNGLYTIAERGVWPLGKPQKTLYELIWKPLENELTGIQTIYFSPSGLLHRLNLGAVPISEEETLGDRYQLVEMGSTRQLVTGNIQPAAAKQDAILFGGLKYDMDSTMILAPEADSSASMFSSRNNPGLPKADSTHAVGEWSYLKWTEKEVNALETILKNRGFETTLLKGYAATEEAFKSIGKRKPSPRVLHLATHGFFFSDPKESSSSRQPAADAQEPVFKVSDNPMIRSGLLLAGGNYAWKSGKPLRAGMEDGILTAYEISQMNLSNTELVVLSACETGLGDIEGNEGVYGLQRAFKTAGAKYLAMSLWQVPDQETSVFMTTFYQHWLEEKMPIPDAFRTTQREMRERFINPYQWAGFVLVE